MLSLFLPSYLSSSYLHWRWWHQRLRLLGLIWSSRRQKSKLWTAGRMSHRQIINQFMIRVQELELAVVEEFVRVGSLIHSTTQSSPDTSRCSTISHAAMENLNNRIWKSRISISTKIKLYSDCVLFFSVLWCCWLVILTCKNRLPYNLYCVGRDVKHCTIQSKLACYPSSCTTECWAVTKRYVHKIGALDQWCLWKLLGIEWCVKWWVEMATRQPHFSAIVQARRFSLFDHIAWMPDETDAKKFLTEQINGCNAFDMAQNRPLWKLMSVWHYALLVVHAYCCPPYQSIFVHILVELTFWLPPTW